MINLALIGSGYWGSKIISSLENNPLVGKFQVIDVKNGQTIDEIESDITTAIIATPLWDHYDTASKLLARGFDCYVEKPMAETAEQCQALKALVDKQILMVGHIFLYHPAMDWIKANIDRIIRVLKTFPQFSPKKMLVYLANNNRMTDIKYLLNAFPDLRKLAAFI